MQIKITYCMMWNYSPQATSLAAAIKREKGIDAELVESKGGIFDVEVDGRLIYSKHETNRFPKEDEVLEKIS